MFIPKFSVYCKVFCLLQGFLFIARFSFRLPGELHVPLEVCGAVVKHELDYWQINENHIKSCCWRNYRSYIEDKRILDSFNRSVLKQGVCKYVDESLEGWQRFRAKVWMILEYPRTSTAAMVSYACTVSQHLFVTREKKNTWQDGYLLTQWTLLH